jgi:LacI family transcriptional regulator
MPAVRSVSLKDIAALAGVSTMTVSRVLGDKGHVSPAKQQAVREAAKRLGYQPNPVVQQIMSDLRRGRAHAFRGTIAFLNSSPEENSWHTLPYLRPCWDGARQRAEETGFAFDDIWINRPGWSPARTHGVLKSRGIRGLLVVPGSSPEQFRFPLEDFALASFGGLAFPLAIHEVLPDYFHNYATCYRRLWDLGYRRIGLFAPQYELAISGEESLGGFLSAQWRSPARNRVPVGSYSPNWGQAEAAFKEWVREVRPDAVIANYNQVRRWLLEIGLSCPKDIGLAHPGLAEDVEGWSGIDADLRAQGAQAVDLLTAQIFRNEQGIPSQPKRLTIRGTWTAGRTATKRATA